MRTVPANRQRASRVGRLLARRSSWALLAAVVVAALAFGSVHPGPPTASQRIGYLEGIIKCPVCEDVSIAQSDARSAATLRTKVAELVHAGASNDAIEQYVVAAYGPTELLRPSDPVIWILPLGVVIAGVLGLVVVLVRRRRGALAPDRAASAEDEAIVEAERRRWSERAVPREV